MSRIFISHSSKNNAEALALREWLASQGWNDVFLDIDPERGLVAADRWQKALNNAIGRCRAVIFLLSPDWVQSKHCISELDLAGHIGAQRIGVIVQDLPLDQVPAGLGGEQQVINLTRGGTPVSITVNPPPERQAVIVTFPQEDLLSLRSGLAKLGLVGFETDSFPWPPADEPDRAPYRGLQALDVKDAGVFYGRDSDLIRAREELLDLRERGGRKLFCVVGASGSGKSSFLRAGLLPRLEREDRDFWALPLLRPQTAALSGTMGLAASLEKAFAAVGDVIPLGELLTTLETDEHALPRLLNRLQVQAMQKLGGRDARPPTMVLAIDQAEELFAVDANQEAARIRQHLAAALTRGPDTIGMLTIRSDRFSLLQNDEQLRVLLVPFNLPPVDASVYRDAIFRPAARSNPPIEVDERLVETLIKDTAAEGADPLPLLAFTLERLYWRHGKALRKLEPEHYEALGGLTGSIEAAIAEAFAEPSKDPAIPTDRKERDKLLEAAFIPALVDINPANGEPLSRIAGDREMPTEARSLVERLVNARLLVSDEGDGGKTYRVAHEAILRCWGWLRALLDQKASLLNTVQVVEQQAEAWDKAERSKAWLDLRGERLREAAGIAARNDFKVRLDGLPATYLKACRRREIVDTWQRLATSMIVILVMLAGGYGAWVFKKRMDAGVEHARATAKEAMQRNAELEKRLRNAVLKVEGVNSGPGKFPDYDNEPIANYHRNTVYRRLGRPVGRLDIKTNAGVFPCTAFLVSSKYILTAHHCGPGILENAQVKKAGATKIEAMLLVLGYVQEGSTIGVKQYKVRPQPVEHNKKLHYALLEVLDNPANQFGTMQLSVVEPLDNALLWIIGHPLADAQHISRKHCRAASPAVSDGIIRHLCDTLPGNSGSPLIDPGTNKVIGIHILGYRQRSANHAIPLSRIIKQSPILRKIL